MNLSRSLLLSTLALAAALSCCATGPSARTLAFQAELEQSRLTRERESVGSPIWRLQTEQALQRKPVETTPEFRARTDKLLSTPQTAQFFNRDYFRYDADTETLVIDVSDYPAKLALVGRHISAAEYDVLPGPCGLTLRQPMVGGRGDSVSPVFLLRNLPTACVKAKTTLTKGAVRVPRAEMEQAFPNLVWHVDMTPAPDAAGQFQGAYSLRAEGLSTIFASYTSMSFHELRLVDKKTGKVYSRAAAKR